MVLEVPQRPLPALWVLGVIENIESKQQQQLESVVIIYIIAPATRNGPWQPKRLLSFEMHGSIFFCRIYRLSKMMCGASLSSAFSDIGNKSLVFLFSLVHSWVHYM